MFSHEAKFFWSRIETKILPQIIDGILPSSSYQNLVERIIQENLRKWIYQFVKRNLSSFHRSDVFDKGTFCD